MACNDSFPKQTENKFTGWHVDPFGETFPSKQKGEKKSIKLNSDDLVVLLFSLPFAR